MLEELLRQFDREKDSGPFADVTCHHQPGAKEAPHVVISVLTHGNEYGTLPAALQLVKKLKSGELESDLSVSVVLANPEAARSDRRYLEEDLNRVFTFDRAAESHERRRAQELRPVLDRAGFFLDVHQTQTPSASAFYTFPWSQGRGAWARAIAGAPRGITRRADAAFAPGQRCIDEYVRDRGALGLTLEVGTRGFDDAQAARALEAMERFVSLANRVQAGESIEALAQEHPPIEWFLTSYVERRHGPTTVLREGLGSWTWVEADEVITAAGQEPLRVPAAGYVLFPKYPVEGQPLPEELYRLAQPVQDPRDLEL